jgi:uncharacterized protein
VALLDRSERHHRQCSATVKNLDAPLITCEAVIAEACHLVRRIKGAATAVLQNVERGKFVVPYRLTGNAGSILRLMNKYQHIPMDFADACLVDMATSYQTGRIVTLDGDFHFYRWGKNRPFELLIPI